MNKSLLKKVSVKSVSLLSILVLIIYVFSGCAGKKSDDKYDISKIKYDILVAQDGSGDFTSVKEAIESVPENNTEPVTIYVRKGTYKEKVRIDESRPFITLIGEDKEETVITYDDYLNKVGAFNIVLTEHSAVATVNVTADDFTAENITFENSAGSIERAMALYVKGDRNVYRNCRITGYQDTLYVNGNRQYFENCYISGCTDFIYGGSVAVFNKCTIYSDKKDRESGGYITAASTAEDEKFGFVFIDCKLDGNTPKESTYLGRPWQRSPAVAYINCTMGEHINPAGWHNWGDEAREKTARYYEYNSKGSGANIDARVKWSKQLTEDEAAEYTVENVLKGDDGWNPLKDD